MADIVHHDRKVLACVDKSRFAHFVADYASWAARGLNVPLEFLHILDRHPELSSGHDHSGSLGPEPQHALMEQLIAEDSVRSKIAREEGRLFLSTLRDRAMTQGISNPSMRQRYGELEDTLVEQQGSVELFVLGRRGESAQSTGRDLGRNLERMVRALQKPILAVTQEFVTPSRVMVAFDGGVVTRRGIEMIANSVLFRSLPCDIVLSGEISNSASEQLEKARIKLSDAGMQVEALTLPGDPEREIVRAIQERSIDMLVMGAYSHSVLRRIFRGSRTSDLLRAATVPTLLLR